MRIASRARRFTMPLHSFLSSQGIREELQSFGNARFEELELPLAVVATDIYRRCEVTFTTGVVWPAVLASMALPGIYPPIHARGSYLVDGGLLSPVPAKQARALGAGVVVGVRLTGKSTSPKDTLDFSPSRPLATDTMMRAMEIMHNRISEMSNDQADTNVEVSLEGGGLSDFKRGREYVEQGYRDTMAEADKIVSAVPVERAAS
jgi:NTE family protein